ncbi:MAG: peptidoglycan DL-endopeptidase CwlO [Patescibacteria group bacterium]|nr:peptidoglycan DL-endopeptidase CwlO [Patescibacteria group bacterium]
MKLRITKPASIPFLSKILLVITAIVISVSVPIQMMTKSVNADQYDDKINALQEEVNIYNAEAEKLSSQAKTLQIAVSELQNQAAATQAKIDISQAEYDKLIIQISETEQKIKDNQDALGVTIADLYVDNKISPIEMIASSSNISEFMDKQEYRNSVRDELTSTITKIKELKTQLDSQKEDVKSVLDKQKAQKDSLLATQSQQQTLLDETKGDEATYQQLVTNSKQKMNEIASQQQAYYQSLVNSGKSVNSGTSGNFQYSNWSGNQGCSGGYPYCQSQDSIVDPWQLYNRECVSYVAWALSERFDKDVGGFHGSGMPDEWLSSSVNYSNATRVYDPQPGDAVVLPSTNDDFAPVGHLMIVESVSGDNIHVSQYNFYGTGEYSTMDIKNSGIILIRFPNK